MADSPHRVSDQRGQAVEKNSRFLPVIYVIVMGLAETTHTTKAEKLSASFGSSL